MGAAMKNKKGDIWLRGKLVRFCSPVVLQELRERANGKLRRKCESLADGHHYRGFSLVRIEYLKRACEPIGTGIVRIHFQYVAKLNSACLVRRNTDCSVEGVR